MPDQTAAVAVLQEQMKTLVENVNTLTATNKDILDQLNIFNSAVKAGKWIFISFLLTMGALGHKGYDYIAKFFVTGQ